MAVRSLHLINNDAGPQTLKSRAGDAFNLGIYLASAYTNAGGGTANLVLGCTDSTGVNAPTTVTCASQAAAAGSDPYWNNVVALLHMDGANNSTAFVDSSPLAANWVAAGAAKISTAQSKFGGSSLFAPGATDLIRPPASLPASTFAFGTGDFTIEMWIYMLGTEANNQILYDGRGSGSSGVPLIYMSPAATGLFWADGATTLIGVSGLSLIGAWHHVACTKNGTSCRMFLDGTQIGGTATDSATFISSVSNPVIANGSGNTRQFNGYMDDLRITKGTARYTANFTPPTQPFDTVAWTYLQGVGIVPAGYDTVDPQLQLSGVPTTDTVYVDDAMVREVTLTQQVIGNLYGGTAIGSTVLPATIPGLDGSKIISGLISQGFLSITSLAGSVINSLINPGNVPGIDASKIISGALTGATVPGSQLTGSVLSSLLSGAVALGLIPALPASQVTSGAFAPARVPGLDASSIISGLFGSTLIPNIGAGTGPGQSSDLQTTLDNMVSQLLQNGGATSGNTPANAALALSAIQNTVTALGSKVQGSLTSQSGQSQSGKSFQVYFNQYPAGPFSAAPFNTSVSGAGSGALVLSGGNASWNGVGDGDVSELGIFNNGGSGQAFTNTDYQELQAQLAGLPNGTAAKNFAVMRSNAAGTTYVYGLVYLSGSFSLNWEIGCYVSGVQHVFASGTNAPLNLAFTMLAGVGGNPYRFQGISGNSIVFDYIDSANISQLGALFRYWGFRSDTANSGNYTPAPASYVGCADNAPPAAVGSTYRSHATAGSTAASSTAAGQHNFASTWWSTNDVMTSDLTPITSGAYQGGVQVSIPGTYRFELRQSVGSFSMSSLSATISPCAVIHRAAGGTDPIVVGSPGAMFANAVGTQIGPLCIGGGMDIYLNAGDIILPAYWTELVSGAVLSVLNWIGDANGRLSWWSLTLDNCSYN